MNAAFLAQELITFSSSVWNCWPDYVPFRDDVSSVGYLLPSTYLPHLKTISPCSAPDSDDKPTHQVWLYLEQLNITQSKCPLTWLDANDVSWRCSCCTTYLSAPATLVPSEQLFSSAGHVYSDWWNSLLPDHAEMQLFIKHNLAFSSDD